MSSNTRLLRHQAQSQASHLRLILNKLRLIRISGLGYTAVSSLFFAVMNAFVYEAQLREPEADVVIASFIRMVLNLAVIIIATLLTGRSLSYLLGDRRPSLWLRGIFGTGSLICSFIAIKAIGVGESAFLSASNGIFIALLGPVFLGQRNTTKVWVAIVGALAGLFLLFEPRFDDVMAYGRPVGLLSGLFAAFAYLMIARAGKSNSSTSVIFYFCVVSIIIHLGIFASMDITWPRMPATYLLIVAAGIAGSLAQIFLTKGYQTAPAALNAAVSYLLPVFNLIISIIFFKKMPDSQATLGAIIVLVFGVMLPFARLPKLGKMKAAKPPLTEGIKHPHTEALRKKA